MDMQLLQYIQSTSGDRRSPGTRVREEIDAIINIDAIMTMGNYEAKSYVV